MIKKYNVTFWYRGREMKQKREAESPFGARVDIILSYPGAKNIRVSSIKRSKNFKIRWHDGEQQREITKHGTSIIDIRRSFRENNPEAKQVSVVPIGSL